MNRYQLLQSTGKRESMHMLISLISCGCDCCCLLFALFRVRVLRPLPPGTAIPAEEQLSKLQLVCRVDSLFQRLQWSKQDS